MTRETKIGLLVGLAFIIVIGILLSDHLTSSTEPPPAPLAGAGSSVRSGVTSPAGQGGAPVTAGVIPPQVQPQQQVLTRGELAPPAPHNGLPVQVDVGGPRNPPITRVDSPVTLADPNPADSTSTDSAQASSLPQNEQTVATNDTSVNAAVRNAARQHGEEVVPVGGARTNPSDHAASGEQRSVAGGTKYVAVEGDTLSKLAGRFLGGNTKPNRDAILAANPSMKGDPNRVIVGRTYIIPSSVGVPASAGMSSQPIAQAPAPTLPQAPAPAAENWYTVKPNDSLWRIATDQCGGANAIPAIQELNKDRLKGENHDVVIEGMKLRLPGKSQVASN